MAESSFTRESWNLAYRELLETAAQYGLPEEVGKMIAKNLGSERAMRRMISYFNNAHPRTVEDVADEMVAIMEDCARWREKKLTEESNMRYNAWLNSDERMREE